MIVPFDQLPDDARVWIYPSNKKFDPKLIEELQHACTQFLEQWTAHGQSLHAGFCFPYNQFIVIGLNQQAQAATGCSIDASVRFIQQLESQYDLILLDKMNVTFKQGTYVSYKTLTEFKAMASQRAVSKNTIVFNNLVVNKTDFLEAWEVPAYKSWHSRFY
ncbi:MAG: ABC transporter ATPase [Bacteroidetes bacterium]|nr:ABC transporter ATPase [Bacteroidota bacterium]MDA1344215.1 ABC transporter ATPase [Bacteroidota bacterium]